MPKLREILTGKEINVSDAYLSETLNATGPDGEKIYELLGGQDVRVFDPQTETTVVMSSDDFKATEQSYGLRPESKEEFLASEDRARMEREHGDIAGKAITLAEGFGSGLSLGATDVVGGWIGGDDYRTRRKERRTVNETESLVGEGLSYLAPTGLAKAPGLIGKAVKYTPLGLAERAGQRIAARGLEKGIAKQAAYSAAGLATEGALVSAGQVASDYGLATSDLERERVIGNAPSDILFGTGAGGVLGGVSGAVGGVLSKSRKIADDINLKRQNAASISDEVAVLDKEGIRAARQAEQELISEQIFDGVSAYRKMADDVDPMLLGIEKGELRLAKKTINKQLKSPKDFKDAPGKAVEKQLRREENALREILNQREGLLAKLAEKDTALVKKIDKLEDGILKGRDLANRYNDFAGTKFTAKNADEGIEIAADEIARFRTALQNGEAAGLRKQALDRIPEVLEANLIQQDAITALKKGSTPRLTELRIAEDALKSGGRGPKGAIQNMAEGAVLTGVAGGLSAIGIPWQIGAMAGAAVSEKLSSLVLGGFEKAAKKTGKNTASLVDRFLDLTEKTNRVAPPLATKILASSRFGEEQDAPKVEGELAQSYKAREAEIYSKVTRGPNGITMKPAARQDLADKLSGVKMVDAALADALETMANRRISFLARKLPKRPDFLKDTVGPDTWVPNSQDIRTFARYVDAVDNPHGVEERLADGTISPEDVEAYKEVYPERYRDLRNQIATRLPELQGTLPIGKRMALSIFSDLEVEPSLNPAIFDRLQAQFGEDPGSEGGTQAPLPQANFGAFGTSRSADKIKTPSQRRAD